MEERAVIVFFSPVTATSMTSPYVDSDSSTSCMGGYIYKVATIGHYKVYSRSQKKVPVTQALYVRALHGLRAYVDLTWRMRFTQWGNNHVHVVVT